MSSTRHLILVDSDLRRRAAISHCLADSGIHVEPFEGVDELAQHWPQRGIMLVHDDGASIARLLDHMGSSGHWLPVIGFSECAGPREIVEAVLKGAIDYIAWPFDTAHIATVVADAEAKAKTLSSVKLREAMARSRIERLTRREREVLAGVAGGLSNRLIGDKLAISPRTVEIHRANMLNKMGANHTSEAIRIAIEASLVN